MNEALFIASILLCFSFLLLFYKFFGKAGLFVFVSFAQVFANIEVLKTVRIFGIEATLGNALFGTIFLATDIISEQYGEKDAKRAVYIGFATSFLYIVLSQLDLSFVPSENDFVHGAMNNIFILAPRVCIGSMLAYLAGNYLDIFLYNRLKNIHGKKHLWLRNNISTLISQLFDNFIFYFIAFYGIMKSSLIVNICINVWFMEAIVAVCDTPFLYIAKKIKTSDLKKNEVVPN